MTDTTVSQKRELFFMTSSRLSLFSLRAQERRSWLSYGIRSSATEPIPLNLFSLPTQTLVYLIRGWPALM